jgi:hypothetical protein
MIGLQDAMPPQNQPDDRSPADSLKAEYLQSKLSNDKPPCPISTSPSQPAEGGWQEGPQVGADELPLQTHAVLVNQRTGERQVVLDDFFVDQVLGSGMWEADEEEEEEEEEGDDEDDEERIHETTSKWDDEVTCIIGFVSQPKEQLDGGGGGEGVPLWLLTVGNLELLQASFSGELGSAHVDDTVAAAAAAGSEEGDQQSIRSSACKLCAADNDTTDKYIDDL